MTSEQSYQFDQALLALHAFMESWREEKARRAALAATEQPQQQKHTVSVQQSSQSV